MKAVYAVGIKQTARKRIGGMVPKKQSDLYYSKEEYTSVIKCM